MTSWLNKHQIAFISLLAIINTMPLHAQTNETKEPERSSVTLGVQIGNSFKGIELCALSGHGSGLLAVQKFEQDSSTELQLGYGLGGFKKWGYFGILITGVAGSYTGAGLGLHLRGGLNLERFCIGISGQTTAGSKKSHSELMAFVGYRF